MTDPEQPQGLTLIQLLSRIDADLAQLHALVQTPEERDLIGRAGCALLELRTLARGAEPYWMQDVRLAQRKIEAARARSRAARSSAPSE